MRRYLEIVFGHKRLLLAPLLAALLATSAYVLVQPASYQASATLWAAGGGVGTESAAQAQADIATQLLKTNAFAMSVADHSPLGSYLDKHRNLLQSSGVTGQIDSLIGRGSNAKPSADAIRQYLATIVTVVAVGASEFSVTVNAPAPELASGTATALVSELSSAEVATRIAPTQTQLSVYESQLQTLSAKLDADLAAVRAYLAAHPSLASNPTAAANDAQLSELEASATQDRQDYLGLLAKIDQAQSDIQLAQQPQLAPFSTVDAAQTPSTRSVLGKQQLLAIGAGLLAGLLLMVVMGAVLTRIDTTIYTTDEVPAMVGLRVIGSTPLSARA